VAVISFVVTCQLLGLGLYASSVRCIVLRHASSKLGRLTQTCRFLSCESLSVRTYVLRPLYLAFLVICEIDHIQKNLPVSDCLRPRNAPTCTSFELNSTQCRGR
jgi:hypothetical protein